MSAQICRSRVLGVLYRGSVGQRPSAAAMTCGCRIGRHRPIRLVGRHGAVTERPNRYVPFVVAPQVRSARH